MQELLFSFNGRIRRSTYWMYAIGAAVALGIVASIGAFLGSRGGILSVGWILSLAAYVALIWIALALQIKRWHDRDKAWVWIFISFIPLVGPIWALIECGFLDGTPGPNKFGPSPKGIAGPAPVSPTAPAT
jgi:uncharacterized membrane protein YhaH (DUF805 family)